MITSTVAATMLLLHGASELPQPKTDAPASKSVAPKKSRKKQLVGVSFGGVVCDNQWFTLPASAYGPYTAPVFVPIPGNNIIGNAPYATPSPQPINLAGDNPPPASNTIPTHANITRYWTQPPQVTIVIPPSVPALANGQPNLNTPVSSTFTALPASGYTWQNWVNDVTGIFARYTAVTTANVPVPQITVAYASTNYTTVSTATSPAQNFPSTALAGGKFVWASAWQGGVGGIQGPTGNGINEIILTDQNTLAGKNGLTSMLVDPATGIISEADVLIYAGPSAVTLGGFGGMFQTVTPGNNVTTPSEWTALAHEIGHFYGMDHTNLHPGVPQANLAASASTQNYQVSGASATPPTTFANYPIGAVPVAGFQVVPIPAMSGIITHTGLNFNYTTSLLHPDDALSLSRIYPVAMPLPNSSKVPLINITGRVEGRLLPFPTADAFGRNVWVSLEGTTGLQGVFPIHGALTGCARLDRSDPAIFNGPATPYRSPSGVPFFSGASVVGKTGCTNDFSIDGIFPGGSYEVVFEDGAPLGVTSTPLNDNFAEWFQEVNFYKWNPFSPTPSYGPRVFQNATYPLFGSAFTSMNIVAGTVITLDPNDHSEQVLGSTSSSVIPEFKTRPVVAITPRTGRAAATNLIITATPTLTLQLAKNGAQLWLNGTNQSSLLAAYPGVTQANGSVIWTIPMTAVVAQLPGITTTTPLNVSFLVKDVLPSNAAPFVAEWGRNDVVL